MAYILTKEALEEILTDLGISLSDFRTVFKEYDLDPSERENSKLFWRDDMENYSVCKWTPKSGGTARYINSAIPAYEGDYVLDIFHSTDTIMHALTWLGPISLSEKFALEIRWYAPVSTISQLSVELELGHLNLGNYILNPYLVYNTPPTSYWAARNSSGVTTKITDDYIRIGTWNLLKLVIDLANRDYYKLKTQSLDTDLSSLGFGLRLVDWGTQTGFFRLKLGFTGNPTNHMYFDDVRVYLNEE